MISICIPVFNYDVSKLINQLIEQINSNIEIICIDDASTRLDIKNKNAQLLYEKKHISYIELTENIGRSAIRNQFLKFAKNEYLLFLDCDSELSSKKFIINYINVLNDSTVFYGGRIYPEQTLISNSLHYCYGTKREVKPWKVRINNPYGTFYTHNFLVHKKILEFIPFNNNLTQYGYEDVAWANELKKQGVLITHINNEIIHIGLDSNLSFVNKSKLAVQNLILLQSQGLILKSKLTFAINWIYKLKLANVFIGVYKIFEVRIENHLVNSTQPNLQLLDLLKINTGLIQLKLK